MTGCRDPKEIAPGKRTITPSLSIRFGAFFGRSEDFRHGIRVECDFRALRKEKAKLTAKIRRVEEVVGG
jgi:plasmid maintenance system antidote protein VapI